MITIIKNSTKIVGELKTYRISDTDHEFELKGNIHITIEHNDHPQYKRKLEVLGNIINKAGRVRLINSEIDYNNSMVNLTESEDKKIK